jgi:F-type H+-transporting ATPase subunit gamma
MPSLKDVKVKIAGVGKTKQITKAMYMVASAKLRGSQARIERFRLYAEKFQGILGHLAEAGVAGHPLLEIHARRQAAVIVLITSDRGLCGGLNTTLIAKALEEARARKAQGLEVSFVCVGKKGRAAVARQGFSIGNPASDEMAAFDFSLAGRLGARLTEDYAAMRADEVTLVYPVFKSIAVQTPVSSALLPVASAGERAQDGAEESGSGEGGAEYLYEPASARLLAMLLPAYVNARIYRAMLDTSASENAARMMAMDNATRNCDDLISRLTLLYNKTRQASITSELIDIVGGANAL